MMRFGRRSRRFLSRTEEKDLRKSIQNYEQLVQQEPNNPEYWNSLGDLYMRVRERDKALQCYEKAFHLYAADGYTENAIGVGKKILRHDPARASIHLELAKLYVDEDVRNFKAALDEIQRFYQTAKRLSQKELGTVMHILTKVWEDLSKNENMENLPIVENLYTQTEELMQEIAMSGMEETANPLRQEDLASLEEVYGGAVEGMEEEQLSLQVGPESQSPVREEGVEEPVLPESAGEVETGEALEPTIVEEEEGEVVEAPRIEEEEEPAAVEDVSAPHLPEEPEIQETPSSGMTDPSVGDDGEAEALFSALETSSGEGVLMEEGRGESSTASEEAVVEIGDGEPLEGVPPEETGEGDGVAVQDVEAQRAFARFLEETLPHLGDEPSRKEDWLEAGYALLVAGRLRDALRAFQTALHQGAPPLPTLRAIARVYAEEERWDHVAETVALMERLQPVTGEDWKALAHGYALRAQAYQHLGQGEHALKDARRAQILGGTR